MSSPSYKNTNEMPIKIGCIKIKKRKLKKRKKEREVIKHDQYDLYMSNAVVRNMVNAQVISNLMHNSLGMRVDNVNFVVRKDLVLLSYSCRVVEDGYEFCNKKLTSMESMYIQDVFNEMEELVDTIGEVKVSVESSSDYYYYESSSDYDANDL